jgi:hypothetical protein
MGPLPYSPYNGRVPRIVFTTPRGNATHLLKPGSARTLCGRPASSFAEELASDPRDWPTPGLPWCETCLASESQWSEHAPKRQ